MRHGTDSVTHPAGINSLWLSDGNYHTRENARCHPLPVHIIHHGMRCFFRFFHGMNNGQWSGDDVSCGEYTFFCRHIVFVDQEKSPGSSFQMICGKDQFVLGPLADRENTESADFSSYPVTSSFSSKTELRKTGPSGVIRTICLP